MSKFFNHEEFNETVDECDIISTVHELTDWMDHLADGTESDLAVIRVLEEVLEIIAENCTYERAR